MAGTDDPARRFEEVFEAHYWAVRAYVLRRASSSAAEDVVAETFLVAWRRLGEIDGDPLPWLLGVARRLLANHHRGERRRGALLARLQSRVGASPAWEPPTGMSAQMAAGVASLSAREREALLLVAWEGLEPARAARAAGCSPAAFRVRLHRARQRLAGTLEPPPPRPSHPPIVEEAS